MRVGFDWAEFLTLARDLCARGDEAGYRSAVSRAYYSLYCEARDYVTQGLGWRVDGDTTSRHKALWDTLMAKADPALVKLGLEGERLHKKRADADYEGAWIDSAQQKNETSLIIERVIRARAMLSELRRTGPF